MLTFEDTSLQITVHFYLLFSILLCQEMGYTVGKHTKISYNLFWVIFSFLEMKLVPYYNVKTIASFHFTAQILYREYIKINKST